MSYVSLVLAAVRLVVWLVETLRDQKLIDRALAEATLKSLREADSVIEKAKITRADVRADNARADPRLRHDKYERPDD